MSQDIERPAGSVQFLLGDISAQLRNIQDILNRHTFRLDNIESRVETLEKNDVKDSPYIKVIEKGVWGLVALAGIALAKLLGWY